jgi:hypothetical protein
LLSGVPALDAHLPQLNVALGVVVRRLCVCLVVCIEKHLLAEDSVRRRVIASGLGKLLEQTGWRESRESDPYTPGFAFHRSNYHKAAARNRAAYMDHIGAMGERSPMPARYWSVTKRAVQLAR